MIEKYLPLAPNSSIPPPIERLYFVTHFTTVGRKDKEALGYTEEGKFSNFGPTATCTFSPDSFNVGMQLVYVLFAYRTECFGNSGSIFRTMRTLNV